MLFAGERVRIGAFRARPGDALFRDDREASGHLVVFPRTCVRITHEGQRPIVADPTCVVFYNRGQRYARTVVSPEGDRCDHFAYLAEDVAAAAQPFDPAVGDRLDRPFAQTHARAHAGPYLRQRLLVERLRAGRSIEPLAIEEEALSLLDAILAEAHHRPVTLATARDARPHAELADEVRARIGRRYRERWSLSSLSRALGVSAFHLCRVFKQRTGATIHAHLDAVRLRSALERVLDGGDLTTIALDVGYASHSHFTYAFRRAFGCTPSAARASKILTAQRRRSCEPRAASCRAVGSSRSAPSFPS